ncbi:hypothetical protein AYI68_g4421 [Smittium mucronatum]|uniref:Sas10 C-terminal domain-containing protein n=1 Tax=Smittium mucronatum TaxID=133383 RepID=A0A1R0GX53_9FUNG|nr:hypothetical protein AYI68_g4421 [Smittium mucronatum]
MGKSKKKGASKAANSGDSSIAFDKNQEIISRGSISKIHTWDDIDHDSEDEYFEEKDKIYLDDDEAPEENIINDTEVFGLEDEDYDSEDSISDRYDDDENDSVVDQSVYSEEDSDVGAWGAKKKDYYDKDEILASSDEEEAELDEEEEALKLQKKFLSQLSANDFLADLNVAKSKQVKEINRDDFLSKNVFSLGDLESANMISVGQDAGSVSRENKLKIILKSNPELPGLIDDLKASHSDATELSDLISKVKGVLTKNERRRSNELVFAEALYQLDLVYISNISFYLMVLSSPVSERSSIGDLGKIFGVLNKINSLFDNFSKYKKKVIDSLEVIAQKVKKNIKPVSLKKIEKEVKPKVILETSISVKPKKKLAIFTKPLQDELDVNDYSELSKLNNKSSKNKIDLGSDFGESANIDEIDFLDKSLSNKKKSSLRHFASKATKTKTKKGDKRQLMDGDYDIPYKSKKPKVTTDLSTSTFGEDLDSNQAEVPLDKNIEQDDYDVGNDYYKQVKEQSKSRKVKKKPAPKVSNKELAWKSVLESNLEAEAYAEDTSEKRPINYQILKNKGLTPKRNKINRNPRVKKKVKYAAAKKKLSSTRQIYKTPSGPYGGEATGIKTNLSKSVRLG